MGLAKSLRGLGTCLVSSIGYSIPAFTLGQKLQETLGVSTLVTQSRLLPKGCPVKMAGRTGSYEGFNRRTQAVKLQDQSIRDISVALSMMTSSVKLRRLKRMWGGWRGFESLVSRASESSITSGNTLHDKVPWKMEELSHAFNLKMGRLSFTSLGVIIWIFKSRIFSWITATDTV